MQPVDGKVEALRIGVSSAAVVVCGLTLNEWVAVFTIIYFIVQIIILSPKALKITRDYIIHIKVWIGKRRD